MSPRPTICRKRGCYIHGSPSGEGERCPDCPYEREAKMTMHRLIIKGTIEEARLAAEARGVTLKHAFDRSDCETHGYADCDNATLAKWFCEPPNVPPFPVGTLLHYTDGHSGDKR